MARRAHAYPQVTLTAADLLDAPLASAPARITVVDGLRLARRRGARVLACGPRVHVLIEDLARAAGLGLGDLPAADVARPLPLVASDTPELDVRRALAGGAPAVVVAGRASGVVTRPPAPRTLAMGERFRDGLTAANRAVLDETARLAAAHGARAFLAGGLVRDLWRGAAAGARDLDVVVEGDGIAVARALADALGGALVEHDRFLTASVRTEAHGRIDVVTARTERYEMPGALPRVLPGSIAQDLRRRDFTVNAMAAELGPASPLLLDPLGGVGDLAERRLRILHPLSFVEDPTRMLRAARYATRLALTPDRWTLRCQALALRLGPYPALSPARIAAELERLLAEPQAARALAAVVDHRVVRLLEPRWRAMPATAARLATLDETLAFAASQRVAAPLTVGILALAADQPPAIVASLVERAGLTGDRRRHVEEALADGPRLAAQLGDAASRSGIAELLRDASGAALAWLYASGEARLRERVAWYVGEGRSARGDLGGDDVIALGVARGPEVSRVLRTLRDGRLDGRFADRQAEIDYVRSLTTHDDTTRDERKG